MCVHLFLVTEKVGQAGHGYAAASHSHGAGGRLPSLLSPAQSDTVPLTGLYWYGGPEAPHSQRQPDVPHSCPISPCLQ